MDWARIILFLLYTYVFHHALERSSRNRCPRVSLADGSFLCLFGFFCAVWMKPYLFLLQEVVKRKEAFQQHMPVVVLVETVVVGDSRPLPGWGLLSKYGRMQGPWPYTLTDRPPKNKYKRPRYPFQPFLTGFGIS